MPRKRDPGRPKLGRGRGRDGAVVSVRLTKAQYKAIEAYVAKENAEVSATPGATAEDRKPATVSSWVRDVIEDAIP